MPRLAGGAAGAEAGRRAHGATEALEQRGGGSPPTPRSRTGWHWTAAPWHRKASAVKAARYRTRPVRLAQRLALLHHLRPPHPLPPTWFHSRSLASAR